MSSKYHTTIEDCPEDDQGYGQQSMGSNEIDVGNMESSNIGSKRQAWEEVDALEEQARSEKLEDKSTIMANAKETAQMIKDAQQSSGI